MKYLGISGGHIIEGFYITPGIAITWMQEKDRKYWNITFSWLFWYFTIGEIRKKLKEHGYY